MMMIVDAVVAVGDVNDVSHCDCKDPPVDSSSFVCSIHFYLTKFLAAGAGSEATA